jgi:hypothetical protein
MGGITHAEFNRRGGASKSALKLAAIRKNLARAQATLAARRAARKDAVGARAQ